MAPAVSQSGRPILGGGGTRMTACQEKSVGIGDDMWKARGYADNLYLPRERKDLDDMTAA
jgi:hypothetical protein